MRPLSPFFAGLIAGAALSVGLCVGIPGKASFAAGGPMPAKTPVLVELFTSEGCSSCPPADRILEELATEQPVAGVEIVPLAFHVDYWNDLGWADPYSAPKFTERQRGYVRALRGSSAYTPEAIVDGRSDVVGSRRDALLKLVRESQARAKTPISLESPLSGDGAVSVTVHVGTATVPAKETPHLVVALAKNEAVVPVARGENGGKKLRHTAIVRSLDHSGPVAPATSRSVTIATAGLERGDYRVVAFLEEPSTHAIVGVATSPVRLR
jgi:hypothetical protein